MFTVTPAIDVAGGRVVRLYQGSPSAMTVYNQDPVAQAAYFVEAGAPALHLVDLDGAFGRPGLSAESVRDIVALRRPVQLGGGIRTVAAMARWLELGVSRVLVGSAVQDRTLLAAMAREAGPGRLVVSLDIRSERLAVDGWRVTSGLDASQVAESLQEVGLNQLVVTAVERDGTELGPDLALVQAWVTAGFRVTGAGGVRHVQDLRALKAVRAEGAVVGRAFYEGRLTMREALGC
jgi:phosphoribosylformimino-5-aminoimidazole carboxamide ribotide isomerase